MRPSTRRDNWAIGQTGLTLALVGSQSRRRKTLTPNPRVTGVLDSWTRDGPGSRRKTGFSSRAPAWVTAPVPPGKVFLSQWLGEGYSDVKPTAWKSPQPSQPAEPLRKDPRPKEWDQLARSDFHYKTTQRRREEEKKSPTATEKGRTDRYRMVLEVAVSTLHVGGSDVWVASLLT